MEGLGNVEIFIVVDRSHKGSGLSGVVLRVRGGFDP